MPFDEAGHDLANIVAAEFNSVRRSRVNSLHGMAVHAYGGSYLLMDSRPYYTDGYHALDLFDEAMDTGTITSYAVGGAFILDVVGGLVNDSVISGGLGQVSGAMWPGASSRPGLMIIDSIVNDLIHGIGGVYAPWIITTTDGYLEGIRGMYRAALALMSSESRIETGSATLTGTWTTTSSPAYSGGVLHRTTVANSKAAFMVMPPQTGPLAGKVFLLMAKFNAATGTMAKMKIDIDGANAQYYTPSPWGAGLSTVTCYDCMVVEVPVDNASHTVNVTHSGSGGEYLMVDCLLGPSETPPPILVMGGEHPIKVGVWDAAQIAMYKQNMNKLIPFVKEAVSEFGNAAYVRSPLTANGLYSTDGVHPNDRGQQQRAAALIAACEPLYPYLHAKYLSSISDANFGIV